MEVNMVKVKCLHEYFDLKLYRSVLKDEELEMDEERAKLLSSTDNKVGVKLVEILTPTPEKVAKTRKKKEE